VKKKRIIWGILKYNWYEIDIASIELFDGNIFHATASTGAEIDLDAAKRLIRTTNKMLPDDVKFRAGIYDISKIAYLHDEARTYFATTNDIRGHVAGAAIFSSTFLGTTIGNLFLSLSGSRKFPIRLLSSPIRAEHWVRNQLKKLEAKDTQEQFCIEDRRKVA